VKTLIDTTILITSCWVYCVGRTSVNPADTGTEHDSYGCIDTQIPHHYYAYSTTVYMKCKNVIKKTDAPWMSELFVCLSVITVTSVVPVTG